MKNLSKENLKFNKDSYEGTIDLDNIEVNITININEQEDDSQNKITFANQVLDWYDQNNQNIKKYASSKLLEVKNEDWTTDSKKVSEDEFTNSMKISDISISKSGRVTIYYQDSGLFYGHTIIVEINNDFSFRDANIAG
jgi:hypothetical protein